MRQSSFKKGLGSGADATRRHVELKKSSTREQREDKMHKRRVGGKTEGFSTGIGHTDSLPFLISSLSTDIKSLPTLYRILRHPESDYYYESSPLYPEIKGPFLFQTEGPLLWLLSLLDRNVPGGVETLCMVTACFHNISAHQLQGVYVPRLIRLGLVEKLIEICRLSDTVYEHTLEIFSNMCLDNAESRNYIVNSKIMQILPHVLGNWPCINAAAAFMRSIFRSGTDLPPPEPLKEFWQTMTHSVLFEHFPDGESLDAGKAANGFSALINILRCIYLLARESDAYKLALSCDVALLNQLAVYCKAKIHLALLIMVELTHDVSLHAQLATPFIPIFVYCMNTVEPSLIIEGAHGLANLAESPESFPTIAHDQVLASIRMQFEYNEVSIAQDLLRQAVAWIIISAPEPDRVYPRMTAFICRLSDAIVLPGSVNVIIRSLEALELLIRWNKDLVGPICEECEVMTRLNRLQHYGNDEMQERVIHLLDWIDRGTEYMEDE